MPLQHVKRLFLPFLLKYSFLKVPSQANKYFQSFIRHLHNAQIFNGCKGRGGTMQLIACYYCLIKTIKN